jgi:hypothetical protein
MGRIKNIPATFKELLQELFREWVMPREQAYRPAQRAGLRKGAPIGMSRERYKAALLQALYGVFPLGELARVVGSTEGALKQARSEPLFAQVALEASGAFADFVVEAMMTESDYYKQKILIESLVLLPGFSVTDDKIIDMMRETLDLISHNPCNSENYDTLLACLQRYHDVFTLVWERTPINKRKNLEDKASKILGSMEETIEQLVKAAKEDGTISAEIALLFTSVQTALLFVTNYSTFVV